MAEFAACHAGGKGVIANGDFLVHKGVSKAVVALCHGADEYADALLRPQCLDEVAAANKRRVKTEGYLAAIWGQMVSNGILYHTKELFVRIGGSDRQAMQ